MTKKYISIMLTLLATAACVSCSSDDDADNSGSRVKVPASVVNGVRISAVGGKYKLNYDEDGVLTGGQYDSKEFSVEGNMKKVEYSYGDYNTTISGISRNAYGYITQQTLTDVYSRSEDNSTKTTITYKFSYNSLGQLQKVTMGGSLTGKEHGESYSCKLSGYADITYDEAGVIQSSEIEQKMSAYGESEEDKEKYVYSNAKTPNAFFLYDMITLDMFGEGLEPLALAGYYGKASTAIPTSYSWTDDNGHKENRTFTLKLNDDGTIRSSNGYTYSYTKHSMPAKVRGEQAEESRPSLMSIPRLIDMAQRLRKAKAASKE